MDELHICLYLFSPEVHRTELTVTVLYVISTVIVLYVIATDGHPDVDTMKHLYASQIKVRAAVAILLHQFLIHHDCSFTIHVNDFKQ